MKNVLISTRTLAIAVTATLATAFCSPVFANDEKNPDPVELKFVGNIDDYPVFQLTFTGEEEQEYIIIIRDEFSNVLYKERIKVQSLSKNFVLKIDGLEYNDIQFEILGKKTDSKVVYAVSKKLHTTEDMLINKIK